MYMGVHKLLVLFSASRLHELLTAQLFVEDMLFVLFVLFLAECHHAMIQTQRPICRYL